MEWLFFVTKPSFMSGMTFWLQIKIYLLSSFALSIFPLLVICILALIDRLLGNQNISRFLVGAGALIPALIISSLVLLLVDNFTYTVFKYGIVYTERISRASYGILFIALYGIVHFRVRSYILIRNAKKYPVKRNQLILLSGFLLFSFLMSFSSIFADRRNTTFASTDSSESGKLPNIILLGSDGLDAAHLSAYGYERDTTPNIRSMLQDALKAENAFPNGGTTAGSVASIMTGKLPLETRVIYPPDILKGEDSYQHLPGILKRLGYYTVDLSVPYFGDALTLNMQEGFDIANQRSGNDSSLIKLTRFLGGGDSAYFVDALLQRISIRLLHIFFISPMTNPYETVIKPASRADEQERFNKLISALEHSESPVFVHVHMLGTHGPRFEIRQQVFSAGLTQDSDWMMDFYDDGILNFDQYIGELFSYLSESGKLKNTIVVVYSDHGMMWKIHQRVPLIFWFPDGKHMGTIQANVQNIDIAPTILDYLDVPIPEWMDGESLISEDLKPPQYIFSASVDSNLIEVSKNGVWQVQWENSSPPFYQVGYVGLVACNEWYELYVQNPSLSYGEIKGYPEPCALSALPTPEQAKQILLDHLFQNGFDVSSFPNSVPLHHFQ